MVQLSMQMIRMTHFLWQVASPIEEIDEDKGLVKDILEIYQHIETNS